jgi:CCR4-NOT transcription complex subunit 4
MMEKRQKAVDGRKQLAELRVVQRNLVFVIGLSPRLADAEMLKKHEYFGKFGKIHKIVVNSSNIYPGPQGPSLGAYITYYKNEVR